MTRPANPRISPLHHLVIDARPIRESFAKMSAALQPSLRKMRDAMKPLAAFAGQRRQAEARLLKARTATGMYAYPDPSPAWLRTTSRRRRAGSRRLKRMVRTRHRSSSRLCCW